MNPSTDDEMPELSLTTRAFAHNGSSRFDLALVIAIFLVLEWFMPLRTAVQIGADEGFELAKATVCLKGYELYSQVWNDQPPLHTFIITQVLRHISPSVLGPRLVTVGFSLLLLISFHFMARRLTGRLAAGVAAAGLIVSPGYLELSSSCMLEIPGLACAISALACLLAERKKIWRFQLPEILSGALFACALQIKLLPAYLIPLAVLLFWIRAIHFSTADSGVDVSFRPTSRKFAASSAIFGITLLVVFIVIDLLIEKGRYLAHFGQSWNSHFGAAKSLEFGSAQEHPFEWLLLVKNWDSAVPALAALFLLASIFLSTRTRRSKEVKGGGTVSFGILLLTFPLIWLLYSLLVFAVHRPWWGYYYVHIAVPLCFCAGLGISLLVKRMTPLKNLASKFGLTALICFAICGGLWQGARAYLEIRDAKSLPKTFSSPVLGRIRQFKPIVRFMFARDPIYSFHTGIPMPPTLTVLPLKRFWASEMTVDRLNIELAAAKPEIILLRNDSQPVIFQKLLEMEYRLRYIDAHHRLFVRPEALEALRR